MHNTSKGKNQLSTLKRAYLKLEELQTKLKATEMSKREPIAIIGMGCRFPGKANNAESFWNILKNGIDAVTDVPKERWNVDAYYDPDSDMPGKMSTRWGAFLEKVDYFDPQCFGIIPREAISMDPQQRLLLEVAWEALENAGQAPDTLSGSRTGVFIGIIGAEYGQLQTADGGISKIDAYFGSGVSNSIASGRISYVFGLQGPSISIDTSCSSSLVSVYLACQNLRNHECEMALAGGVNLMLLPDATIALSRHRLMSSDGRCKTFDAAADGYVRGEGCGLVVLKRFSDALADGDHILAIIRGIAANQDGPSSGLTAPHGPAQQAVIRAALSNADVKPSDIGYIETHGTGTALGDPIEVQALASVLKDGRSSDKPVYIGTVKTNIGHLEAAAGIASLIKMMLVLQHKEIPPHLHLNIPNPFIPWDKLPVTVPLKLIPWPEEYPLITGISSFGFSGTNVHMVLEAYESREPDSIEIDRPKHILSLSAQNKEALIALSKRYNEYLTNNPEAPITDVCFTANTGRAKMSHRIALTANTTMQLQEKLKEFITGRTSEGIFFGTHDDVDPPKIAFLFTGQGAQYVNMGRQLYETQPTFHKAIDRCHDILKSQTDLSLLSVLYSETDSQNANSSMIHQTAYTQPALFALEYALLELWRAWGIEPTAVMGHSLGEYVAACAAGIFSLEDGLKLVIERTRLIQTLSDSGRMAAIFTDEAQVTEAVDGTGGQVSIAAVNGPKNIVISGDKSNLERLIRKFATQGVKSTLLNVSHAFHSPLIEPILDRFEQKAAEINYSIPRIHLISNLTAKTVSGDEMADPSYWRRHMRSPVCFFPSMKKLYNMGYRIFVEIGPHPVLSGMAANFLHDKTLTLLPSLRKGRNDWEQILSNLGQLYVKGARIDWIRFDKDYPRRRLKLPSYPFQRKRFWIERPQVDRCLHKPAKLVHPLLGFRLHSALKEVQFESSLSCEDFRFINDHRVHGITILPATAYIEMAMAGAKEVYGPEVLGLEDVIIHEPLVIEKGENQVVQTIFTPVAADQGEFRIYSHDDANRAYKGAESAGEQQWTLHMSGKIRLEQDSQSRSLQSKESLEVLFDRCKEEISGASHYRELNDRGFEFGPALQGVSLIKRGKNQAIGRIQLPDVSRQETDGYGFPPALLDACLQFFWAILPNNDRAESYLPMSFKKFQIDVVPCTQLWSHISLRPETNLQQGKIEGDVRIYNESGQTVAMMEKLSFRKAGREALLRKSHYNINKWFYKVEWEHVENQIAPKEISETDYQPPSDFIVPTHLIADHIKQQMKPLCETKGLDSYNQLITEIETLSLAFILEAFQKLGWEIQKGQLISEEALIRKMGIENRYWRLLHRLLEILAEESIIKKLDDKWEVIREPGNFDPQNISDNLSSKPEATACAQFELVVRCGEQLSKALTGAADPLALLFPNGSLSLAARLYSESPEAKVYNTLVREAVTKALSKLPEGRKARILELGAGTGGATSFVLPGLPSDKTDYYFTDISPVFLKRAAERFRDYPFVTYRLCNIEHSPDEQEYSLRSFDIVIAMNMIHATTDLKRSLKNVRKLLAPGGMLILLEGTAPERWIDITFGLTDGWWAFTDTELRPSYPLLPRHKWLEVLNETGYINATVAPEQTRLSCEAVIIAQEPPKVLPEVSGKNISSEEKWLIFADRYGVGLSLADYLKSLGQSCFVIENDHLFENRGANRWSIRPDQPEDYHRLFKEISKAGIDTFQKIVHMWTLDAEMPNNDELNLSGTTQSLVTESLLYLLQALMADSSRTRFPELSIVTSGAQPAGSKKPVAFVQAPVLGLSKVIALEHPELKCRCIDIDPDASVETMAKQLFSEILISDQEDLVAIRGNLRLVARLKRVNGRSTTDWQTKEQREHKPLRLEKSSSGILEDLKLRSADYNEPGPGEVQIRVHAAGLGFRDVMNALSMRDDPEPLGSECSGEIVKVSEDVTNLVPGDAVVALASGSFCTFVNTGAELVFKKPKQLSFEEAATLPTVFLTAHYTLNHLAKVCKGEKVLIHAAAGGVGMAAIQLAQQAGAVVFGTAGSTEKRAYLRSIGVNYVMDSRTLNFAEEILAVTNREGVDIIVNSLSGEFIEKSLSILAKNGRFLEIGKRDILTAEDVARIRPDAVYHVVDLAALTYENPSFIRRLFEELMKRVEDDKLKPLPFRTFALGNASAAFRYMAQARHIGKIILTDEEVSISSPKIPIRSDATYLITGGLSGLGLLVAQWFIENGAKYLALMGRSPAGKAAQETIEKLEQKGIRINVFQADVSSKEQVSKCLSQIEEQMPPLRGIVHSAGILADGVLLNQTREQFMSVMAPKINGSWNLHTLTCNHILDFFILFSSTAGLFGSPGQGNHAAANAFLDALAHYRRGQGLPALSINWGVWSEVGSAAKRNVGERIVLKGVDTITPQYGLQALEKAMQGNAPQVAVVPINWPKFFPKFAGGRIPQWLSGMNDEIRSSVREYGVSEAVVKSDTAEFIQHLKTMPDGKRRIALQKFILDQTVKILGIGSSSEMDEQKPLNEQGLDSLMAVELRNLLGKRLGLQQRLPATLVFDYPTIERLTDFLLNQASLAEPKDEKFQIDEKEQPSNLVDTIEELSEEEVDRLLREAEEDV